MDRATIWTKLTELFRELFDDPRLTIGPGTRARDVPGWDSLMHIQLLVAVEVTFEVRFDTAAVAGVADVGALVDLIARQVGGEMRAAPAGAGSLAAVTS